MPSRAAPTTITLLTPEANQMISQLQNTFERSMQQLQLQMRGVEQRVLKTNVEIDGLAQRNMAEAVNRDKERETEKEKEKQMEARLAAEGEERAREREHLDEVEALMQKLMEQQDQIDQVVQFTQDGLQSVQEHIRNEPDGGAA